MDTMLRKGLRLVAIATPPVAIRSLLCITAQAEKLSNVCPRQLHNQAAQNGAAAAGAAGGLLGWLHDTLAANQVAQGGLSLLVVGAAAHAFRTAAEHIMEYGKRKLFVRAEIDSRDDAYRWVMHWLGLQPSFQRSARFSVTTSLMAFGTSGLEGSLAGGSRKVMYLPAPGDHMLRYQGRWVWVSRKRSGTGHTAANARLLTETLTLTTWGRSRALLEALVAEALSSYESTSRQRTVVYSMDADGYWQRVGSRPIRPLTSVVLPGTQAQDLLADCREFLASEEWYAHHGIPYRRGYLLYGVPGSGKTSLVTALAGELGLDIYVVTLASPAMTDEVLRNLLNTAADNCILLLEDVDAAFVQREAAGGASHLTFSGLLNAIDGVAAQEGRLLFMTTNHIERLSSALIRPGRVDVRCEFKAASPDQARALFVAFYGDLPQAALARALQRHQGHCLGAGREMDPAPAARNHKLQPPAPLLLHPSSLNHQHQHLQHLQGQDNQHQPNPQPHPRPRHPLRPRRHQQPWTPPRCSSWPTSLCGRWTPRPR